MYYEDYEDEYAGTYAHDVAGFSDEDIDTIFDGELDCLLKYRLTNLNIYNYEKTIIYLTLPCAGGNLFLQ